MLRPCLFLFLALSLYCCSNIDDASPSARNSFIKFFHGPYNYEGVEVEVLPDGYVVLGNMKVSDDSITSLLIHTDKKGNQIGNVNYFPGMLAKSFEVLYTNNILSGYIIVGDSIKINPDASRVGDIEIFSAKILKVNTSGEIIKQLSYSDNSLDDTRAKVDFKSNTLKISSSGHLIILGTYREDLSRPEKSFVASFDSELKLNWTKTYDLLDAGQTDFNYINARSLHVTNNAIIWASSILKPTPGFSDSYLAVPFVKEGSVFINFSQLGESSSQLFLVRDIQPANVATFGYGIIGSRANTDGSGANLFFARITAEGNFIPNSERYFDGASTTAVEVSLSVNQDHGEAMIATHDGGYVLAGTTQRGNEARNIYLVKVNAFGDILWSKIMGGNGDEVITSIREDEDGRIILCGINNLSGLSSIMLIKTDKSGELID
jgi:hypothetical protein